MSVLQIALAIVGVGFLIAWHEFGHYIVARLLGMRVLRYSLGFGPKILGFVKNDIEYRLSALPLGGYVLIKGMSTLEEGAAEDPRSFVNRPRWARWLVLAAGPGFNYALAFALFIVVFSAWPSPVAGQSAIELATITEKSAAAEAGLREGDFVIATNGSPITSTNAFIETITESKGAPLSLTIVREGQRFDATVAPAQQPDGGFKLGVQPVLREPAMSATEVVSKSFTRCIDVSIMTLNALGALVKREPGVEVSGPVGIVAQMKDQIAKGTRHFLFILALLSVNLGLFNLLPIPSLDGIKMLFLTVEGIARRDINAKAQVYVNAAGLLALLVMLIVVSVKDTIKLG